MLNKSVSTFGEAITTLKTPLEGGVAVHFLGRKITLIGKTLAFAGFPNQTETRYFEDPYPSEFEVPCENNEWRQIANALGEGIYNQLIVQNDTKVYTEKRTTS